MGAKRHFWWIAGTLIVCGIVVLIFATYWFGWSKTGFLNKTLWDWMQLFIVPGTLAVAALSFNLDSKGLALCGLALCEDDKYISEAINAYKKARTITRDAGVTGRVQRLFDALAQAGAAELLSKVRAIALGRE